MMRPDDGRIANCPLCGLDTSFGSLRSHVGSVRCLAMSADAGVVFSPDQWALKELAIKFDAEIQRVRGTYGAKGAHEAQRKRRDQRINEKEPE